MPALWFGLICLILIGARLASKVRLPDAVMWATLGLGLAFIPGIPQFQLDPHLALLLVLPPLVYTSALQLPWPEFRNNIKPIAILAIGLVAVTTIAVSFLAHDIAGLPWAAALALGAVVSPTDPVAASAVASRVGLPQRMVTILEGEGLVNDAVALTTLRIATAGWAGGTLSATDGGVRFLAILVGEPLYGWLLGRGVAYLRSKITDPQIEITVSLLTPFAAYLVPERLGGSGILATVAVGMYMGERSSTLVPAGTRLHATSFWQMIVFLLNGGLFITAGMEMRQVLAATSGIHRLGWGFLVAAAVILLRVGYCALSWYGLQALRRAMGQDHVSGAFRHLVVVAWSGMRGPISLAAALSIPAAVGGRGSHDFEVVVGVTAVVIVTTLLGQGAALPALVKILGVSQDAAADREALKEEENVGQAEATRAALERLSQMESEGQVTSDTADHLRRVFSERLPENTDEDSQDWQVDAIRAELIKAERQRIRDLRSSGRISDYAMGRLQRKLDLREALLD